ncbi:MAG TPA: hypothetical protein VGF14_00440 [Alphaproteobacteria bacterium]
MRKKTVIAQDTWNEQLQKIMDIKLKYQDTQKAKRPGFAALKHQENYSRICQLDILRGHTKNMNDFMTPEDIQERKILSPKFSEKLTESLLGLVMHVIQKPISNDGLDKHNPDFGAWEKSHVSTIIYSSTYRLGVKPEVLGEKMLEQFTKKHPKASDKKKAHMAAYAHQALWFTRHNPENPVRQKYLKHLNKNPGATDPEIVKKLNSFTP